MNNLEIKYHNVDVVKIDELFHSENKTIQKIKNTIINLPALNIAKNHKLLNKTITETNNFAQNKNSFIVLGTGGSNLGSKALINILQYKEKKQIFFYDNIDPIHFENFLKKINLKKIGYIVISKSGSTPETLSQFGCLIEFFDQKKQLKDFYKNCLIITENKPNPLRQIGIKNSCIILDHEIEIGGRYSVFSNVGMVPAIIAGLNVKKIHEGANVFLDNTNNEFFSKYLHFAKLFTSKKTLSQINASVLMTYSSALFNFGKWYMQLWAESIGKKGLGITPIHAVGTTDQHSQLQLYLDGPKDKFFTFITTNHSNLGLKINKNIFNNSNVSYLSGKFMGDLMQAEQRATMDTFKKNKFIYREIFIPTINEFSIGQLMAFFICETVASCYFLGVDPFNQPAVEQGKILTKKYLI